MVPKQPIDSGGIITHAVVIIDMGIVEVVTILRAKIPMPIGSNATIKVKTVGSADTNSQARLFTDKDFSHQLLHFLSSCACMTGASVGAVHETRSAVNDLFCHIPVKIFQTILDREVHIGIGHTLQNQLGITQEVLHDFRVLTAIGNFLLKSQQANTLFITLCELLTDIVI